MTKRVWRWAVCTLVTVLVLSSARHAAAATITFDTSDLAGGTYTLAFDLIDGDGVPSTQVLIDAFGFGGGGLSGVPSYFGAAVGDVATGITLSDTDFFNSFLQDFIAGSSLSFDVTFSGAGTNPPDSFAFSILSAGLPIATTDPGGANLLLFAELGPTPPTITQMAPVSAPIPEPATLTLSTFGLATMWYRRRRAARR